MITGFLAGSFDVIHPGYVMMLEEASNKCDYLVVGIQDDPTIDRPEKSKPINTLFERVIVLKSLKYVDDVIPYNTEEELEKLLMYVKPNIRFLGDDYRDLSKTKITGYMTCTNIHYISRKHNYSSTSFKRKISKVLKC